MLKRKSILRRGVALLCVMWLLWGLSVTVFAADEPDTSRTGSITVTLKSGSISAADGVLTYYEVAALTDGAYVYAEDFSAYTVSRARLSGAELAETLADFTEQNTFTGVSAAVDTEGKVTFDDLELGVYLIVQTEKSTGFDVISPFIVTVPLETDGIWVYDVDAAPKLTVSNSSSTPDDTDDTDEPDLPQTGQLN